MIWLKKNQSINKIKWCNKEEKFCEAKYELIYTFKYMN